MNGKANTTGNDNRSIDIEIDTYRISQLCGVPVRKVSSLIYQSKVPHKVRTGYPKGVSDIGTTKNKKYFIVQGEDAIRIMSVAYGANKVDSMVQYINKGRAELERRREIENVELDEELILLFACVVDRYRIGACTESEMHLGIKKLCLEHGIPWHRMKLDERKKLCNIAFNRSRRHPPRR